MSCLRAYRWVLSPALLALALVASACEAEDFEPTVALFTMPVAGETDLYALPYPNDLRVTPEGKIDLAQLGADQPGLIQRYLDLVAQNDLDGFATNGAAFFRFSAPLSSRSLPATPQASLEPGAAAFWINIDKASPEYGQRVPLSFKFNAIAGRYAGENLLAVLPVHGFVLLPKTRYAVVLTEGVLDEGDISVQADRDFRPLLSADKPRDARLDKAHSIYAPLRSYIAEQNLTGVVCAAVFTTGSPTGLTVKAREVVQRLAAPQASELKVANEYDLFYELRGSYEAPNFQKGDPPYSTPADGGQIELNVAGEPVVARTESMRFAISIPKGTMPPTGWPVVLYAHGTGGDYRTPVKNGVAKNLAEVKDASGKVITQFAVIGIDQVLHGPRAPSGTSVELAFFNFNNPAASVSNVLQGGIDNFQLLRLVKGLTFDSVPWMEGKAGEGTNVDFGQTSFDPQRIYFFGHSQGGLTGPSFLAAEPEIKGAVLSGAGGGAVLSLLYKTAPSSIKPLLEAALKEPVDEYHPVLNLFQQMLEPADPNNYAPAFFHAPPQGLTPKHIFLSEGLIDRYTPTQTTEALAVAMRAPAVGPELSPVEGLSLRKLQASGLPTSGNVKAGSVTVTAGLLQYQAMSQNKSCTKDSECSGSCVSGQCRREGHFVMFDNAEARRQYASFLATMARDGAPTISK
jgi:pimeloyl-ACP methyl ester carboxylesterase